MPVFSHTTLQTKQQLADVSPQPRSVQQLRPIYRAPRPAWQVLEQQQDAAALPDWAEVYRRQVGSLPQGLTALRSLLRAVEHLMHRAEHCGSHSGVMQAYLNLGLIDLTSQAWQHRSAQLQEYQHTVGVIAAAGSTLQCWTGCLATNQRGVLDEVSMHAKLYYGGELLACRDRLQICLCCHA
jgi:hypothetical protein